MPNPLTQQAYKDWQSAGCLLQDSLSRYLPYDRLKKYTPQGMEFYDSLSFRYTKALEAAFYFFRSIELELIGKPSEFLRDQLLKMEKIKIILNVDEWMEARKLRNKMAHAYKPEELEKIYAEAAAYSHMILDALTKAKKFV